MKTKSFLSLTVMAIIMVLPILTYAQRGNEPHLRTQKPHHEKGKLEQVEIFTGNITEWRYNDDYIYDGFYLQSAGESYFVKFPPHLGKEIRDLKGEITVNGVSRYSKEGEKEIKMVDIQGNGKTIMDIRTGIREIQPEQFTSGSGKITQFHFNKKGEVAGYILDDKVLLRIPPHKARQLVQMVETGSKIEYTGNEKTLKDGQVSAKNYKNVHPQTITINGIQYLVR